MSASSRRVPPVSATLRAEDASVKSLELFFDLVFVLALTQCTALMAAQPTWEGLTKGMLILGIMWWTWVGYAWLTSVIDPEEGVVRLAMFTAMAALLLLSLCIPGAFDENAVLFAVGYAFVRGMHIVLFVVGSREDPALRRSVAGLAVSTAVGCALIGGAAFADGALQGGLWALAILLDAGGPCLFGADGWKLVPGHFAERHGLMIIIANAAPGREQNEIARDSFSYLHFPMIAGIVLLALGLKKTLGHVGDPLELVPAAALLGGVALYLFAHVAFRLRNVGRFSSHRVITGLALLAFLPVAVEIEAVASVGVVAIALVALIVYETIRFAELRDRWRHDLSHAHAGH